MKVSAVIPTINEEKSIGNVIDGLKCIDGIEIIVVDTNSTDKTREIAASKGARVIEEHRKGYGRAYKTGIKAASGDIIVCLDGDNTYPTDIIKPLIDILILDKVNFISCDRMTLRTQHSYTSLHFIGNLVLNFTLAVLFKFHLNDSQSGMWIFYKSFYNKMNNLSDYMAFSEDIKIEALKHGKLIEVPILYGQRITKPKLKTWRDGFKNLFHLIIKRIQN
ncbi:MULTISPECIES: glycosyltransferase family 2 protein [Acidiplasma]|jgi:glycosyltransferase involved in cell wall biosynthesis|uniref:Glycosyl transferase n=1 Tax=Acidiplasma aeolicum TaxID=507754 RepID=A0A0Q0RFE3_9ARCH|nr:MULTISPECIES: glycosyltransferase family 2 protein [Acidiplasma]KPV47571.1 glycosyl transferase [Acidiplasma aeolicum]KQB33810.1 glycosyl transferase [Acidiplasma aeolicum]